MIDFLLFRSTHDEDGNPREFSAGAKEIWNTYGLMVHQLRPDRGATVEVLYNELLKHQEIFPDDKLQELAPHEFFIGIAKLLEAGFVRAEVPEEGNWQSPAEREAS